MFIKVLPFLWAELCLTEWNGICFIFFLIVSQLIQNWKRSISNCEHVPSNFFCDKSYKSGRHLKWLLPVFKKKSEHFLNCFIIVMRKKFYFALLSSWMSTFLLPLACEVLLMTVSFAELLNCATGIEIHFRFSSDFLPANILLCSPDIKGLSISPWVV